MHLPFFFPWFLPKSSLFMNSYLLSVLGERFQGKLKMSLFGELCQPGESASALFWCTVSIRSQVGHNSFTQTRPLTQCPHPSASNWTDSAFCEWCSGLGHPQRKAWPWELSATCIGVSLKEKFLQTSCLNVGHCLMEACLKLQKEN